MDFTSTVGVIVLLGALGFGVWAAYKLQQTKSQLLDARWEAASHASRAGVELEHRLKTEKALAKRISEEYKEALEVAKTTNAVKAAELLKKATEKKNKP